MARVYVKKKIDGNGRICYYADKKLVGVVTDSIFTSCINWVAWCPGIETFSVETFKDAVSAERSLKKFLKTILREEKI